MYILRRISLSRLLLLCGLVIAIGVSATAIASALDAGPVPEAKSLPNALHDALAGPAVQGVSANIQFTNRLLEGANLVSGGGEASQLDQSPLLSGASGRLWIAKDGRVRLELQSEKGDTQIIYDGKTLTAYDASTNTLYRYSSPQQSPAAPGDSAGAHEAPSVAKIEEAISHLSTHANVSGATPTDVAGRPAYTVRISPKQGGSLVGGAELSFDAEYGVPLRAAIYSSSTPAPVIELATTEISYGPVEDSVFEFTPPSNAKVQEIGHRSGGSSASGSQTGSAGAAGRPRLTTHGHGVTAIAVLESEAHSGAGSGLAEELPNVKIGSATASELSTALGTVLSFEQGGVRYVVAGALPASSIEEFARGL